MRDLLSKLDRALARLDLVEIQLWVLDAWRAAVVLWCIVAVALLFVRRGSGRAPPWVGALHAAGCGAVALGVLVSPLTFGAVLGACAGAALIAVAAVGGAAPSVEP